MLALLAIPAYTSSCQSTSTKVTIPVDLGPEKFKTSMESNPEAVLIDVRKPEEVAQGKIGNPRNMDFYNPDFKENLLKLDKEKAYFLYCRSGRRSMVTANFLTQNGFKNVYNLKGGIIAWNQKIGLK